MQINEIIVILYNLFYRFVAISFPKLHQCLKLRCDERFTNAFTACSCVFKEITLVWANQGNFFENATACSKCMHKTIVATKTMLQTYLHCVEVTGWEFTKLLMQIHKIFRNLKVLLQSSYSKKIGTLWFIQ